MANEKIINSPDIYRENRLPPGQKLRQDWPVLHYGEIPEIDISSWTFRIFGLVKKENTLDYKSFAALPQGRVHSDIHCVTGWSRFDNEWEGPGSPTIYQLANTLPNANFVIIHGIGDFTTNLTVKDFLEPDVLFALKHNGELLTPQHGYPIRLVVPRLYFWKSAKWVTGIEFSEYDKPGFWESRGYHNRGDPWKEERYSSSNPK
jgi:DMSO/TMAO reductase YedYZ molybdopterin-dependent catalytic subunit